MALFERLIAVRIYTNKYNMRLFTGVSTKYFTCVSRNKINTVCSSVNLTSLEGCTQSVAKCLFPSRLVRRQFHATSRCFGVMEDRDTKALTMWSNLKAVRKSPFPALTLGMSGLLPFISVPAYMMVNQIFMPDMAFAQMAYGAVVLSFIGGVRWGFTLPEENPIQPNWINLGYSVMPSLVAWGGLLLPYPWSLFIMMGGLTVAGYFDMAMFGYPPWFKGLRFLLSFVAVLSLWTTFMCGFLLKEKKSAQKTSNS